jgi:radical SAM protein with 4Fe4S-binding SPASM domain
MNIFDLRKLQLSGPTDITSALRSIVINPIETCNRTCVFCPRSTVSVDTSKQYKINLDLITKIANDLKHIDFDGRIGLNGFGEPLLHDGIDQCVKILKDNIPKLTWLEIQTNGDNLTRYKIQQLADAGCNTLSISMYDDDQSDKFKSMCQNIDIELVLRHHYDKDKNYNLNLINRLDLVKLESQKLNIEKQCYLPFYKFFIDWDGKVLLCNNDVGKFTDMGNVYNETVQDIWLGEKFNAYRKHLLAGDRKSCSPCNRCNIQGTLLGKESFDIFEKVLTC